MKKICLFLFFVFCALACNMPKLCAQDLINDVFLTLRRDYINDLSNKEIALKGLKTLTEISPALELKETSKKIVLYNGKSMVKQFPWPQESDNIEAWVALCHDIMNEAVRVDSAVQARQNKLPDRFATSVFEGLDGYSHYFGAKDDDDDKPLKIRRPFASRVIDKILLLRVVSFKKDMAQNIKNAVEECSKCEGVILDLRGNHGGFLDEAVKIADMFLDEGIITYTLSSDNAEPAYYTAGKGDILSGKPMVILTDGLTASAAEVLAAALSEQNRAVIIGTKTYGKGTVQDVKKRDADHAFAVTTAYFYTPSGIKIDKIGLTPFICVGEDNDCAPADRFTKDEDIDAAVKYLKTGSKEITPSEIY